MPSPFVKPSVYLLGFTEVNDIELVRYLEDTGNQAFIQQYRHALELGLSPAECLVSFYAKLCYASLSPGKNDNIDKTRDIPANLAACLAHGHGSVFGHVNFNFVITNCSRVFTHELVRHHVGTEYSQTSGRYVRTDKLKVVWDPILEPIKHDIELTLEYLEMKYRMACEDMNLNDPKQSFDYKKKVTSALRRMFLPNGVANEIGFSMNVRAARHMIQMRTSAHAEWEIRYVFAQIYEILSKKYPHMFSDAKVRMVDDLPEVYGMRTTPYELAQPKGE